MRECLRLVPEQEADIARRGLLLEQTEAKAGALDRLPVLASPERVPGPAPGEAPFSRSNRLRREVEIATPVRRAIAAFRRGSVQNTSPGSARIPSAQLKAAIPRPPGRPGRDRARSAATPPPAIRPRQARTVSARTRSARPMAALDHPSSESSTARARSASPRAPDRASASSASRCWSVAFNRERPPMTPHVRRKLSTADMWVFISKSA
jgi:hypothetical protein